jgi:hypothetical protein
MHGGGAVPGIRKSVAGAAVGVAALIGLMLAGSITAAGAQTRIGPRQHFIGLVNGSNNLPVVYTVCPGPVWPNRTGPVAGGQTLEVAESAGGRGFTGVFSQIFAWVVPSPKTTTRPPEQTFTTYGKAEPFPQGVRVPCGGTGQVEFSSCPYLAPCAAGWVPDLVKVQFQNIAV